VETNETIHNMYICLQAKEPLPCCTYIYIYNMLPTHERKRDNRIQSLNMTSGCKRDCQVNSITVDSLSKQYLFTSHGTLFGSITRIKSNVNHEMHGHSNIIHKLTITHTVKIREIITSIENV